MQSPNRFLTTKSVFRVTLIVAFMTILGIWLFGLGQHRSIYNNSLLSTTILSAGFFLFIAVGLFKGVKLKDDLGKLTDKMDPFKMPNLAELSPTEGFVDVGEGIAGILISILLWIVMSILILLFFWLFSVIVWTGIIVFIAMLYWIYFRAVRLVFKNSRKCKGNLSLSIAYGLFYTFLYNCWIYGIILGAQYFSVT